MPKKKINFVIREDFDNDEDYKIACKIQQRRLQILVHSYIYYELNTNVVDDSTWSTWGRELGILQDSFPDIAKKVPYDKMFKGFDGSTGMNLKYDTWVKNKAQQLLKYRISV